MCHGVWQSWQPAVLTMYLPRETGSLAGACGESAARANDAATTRAKNAKNFKDFTASSSDYLFRVAGPGCRARKVFDPAREQGQRLGVDCLRAERRHLLQRVARSHAQRDNARVQVTGLDAIGIARRAACAELAGHIDDGALDRVRRRGRRGHALRERHLEHRERTFVVVAIAAVAVQVTERGAFGRRLRGDARWLREQRR